MLSEVAIVGAGRTDKQFREKRAELLRKIAFGIGKIVAFMCGVLAYFATVHQPIESRYGPHIAWLIVGIILALLTTALIIYVWFVIEKNSKTDKLSIEEAHQQS